MEKKSVEASAVCAVDQTRQLLSSLKPLTPQELANFYSVSVNTVYFWVSRPNFPRIKVGKHLRFDIEKVQRHFEESSEMEAQACQGPGFSIRRSRSNSSLKTRVNASRADPSKKRTGHGNN